MARNSCLNTSMREKCVICGRGAEFPWASARRCPTFPHSVYSAHRFSSRSFSSPTRCTGFADSPPVDGKLPRQLLYHGELPTRLDSLHGQCDQIFPLYWDEQHSISLNSAIYLGIYCRAKYFAREFILGQRAFRFSCKVAPENLWHFIELWNEINSITEPTTSTQSRTRIAHMGVGTLNQSTSRDGLWAPRLDIIIISILVANL